jgi:DNA invertase Pin-like site-specific DNA recombinase
MLEFVLDSSNRVDAILVYQTSRFFRDAAEARALKVALRRKGVQVIAICQETEDGPMGSFMEGIFELVDQYESDVNGMRTGAAMRKNAQLGYVNGSVAPFGFKAASVQVGSQAKRKLVPNDDERETVVELFRAYVGGCGAKAAAADLNVRGLRYRGGSLWRKNHVLRVISEPACIGTYYWGQTDSRTKKLRDKSEWIAIPVEPIVEHELFDMAQRIRKERDPAEVKGRTSSSPLLLAGIVCCEQCGSSLGLETSGKQLATGERPFRYYNCRRFLTSGKKTCPGTRIPETKLDQAILEHLAGKVFTQERCRKILEDVVEETGMLRRKTDEQRAALQAQLADIERRVARWQDAFETGAESANVILPRLRELTAKRDELASTLAKVVPLHRPPPHLYTEATLERFQGMLRQVFLSGQTSMTRNYLRFLVERIEVGPIKAEGTAINVVGKSGAAVALMANVGRELSAPVNPQGPVLSSVNDWLQLQDS